VPLLGLAGEPLVPFAADEAMVDLASLYFFHIQRIFDLGSSLAHDVQWQH